MNWKPLIGIAAIMLVLTIIGVATHADGRMVASDALGTIGITLVAVLIHRGGRVAKAMPGVVAVTLLVVTILAVTAHAGPALTALTLGLTFAFGFVALTSTTRRMRPTLQS
jgi:hypothetical protein